MDHISFKLDTFEGPLDLLLHLISKHKLNIYDIEISLLLDQYMEYMNQMEAEDYESAADFLEMAAQLIYIKTRSLLPQPEEAAELKKELEGRIIEYALCKQMAEMLKGSYAGGDIFVRAPVKLPVNKTYTRTHDVSVLYDAYMGISSKAKTYKPLRANFFSPIVSHRIVSVTSKIIFVLKKLYKTGKCDMTGLYDGITDKSEKVATFLAVLELTKSGRIFINDDNTEICFRRTNKKHAEQQEHSETEISAENISAEPQDEPSKIFSDDEMLENELSEDIVQPDVTENDVSDDAPDDEELSQPAKEPAESVNVRTQVKFSSERIASVHTASVRIEPHEAVAAYAPILPKETASEEITPAEQEKIPDEPTEAEEEYCTLPNSKINYWSDGRYYWGLAPSGSARLCYCWKFGGRDRL